MKTFYSIRKMVSAAIIIIFVSVNLQAQKAYNRVSLEQGINELNNAVDRLIEKGKIKFDVTTIETTLDTPPASNVLEENELNELTKNLEDYIKFDVNNTITVTESNEENSELTLLTNELLENVKFDVNKTESVTEANEENFELDELTNQILENVKFDVCKTISVQEEQTEIVF